MRRQQSVLFCGPTRKVLGCRGRPNGIPQDGVATTMVMPEMQPVWRHVDDVFIANMAVRVAMSTMILSKDGKDERWVSKYNKYKVAKAIKMICRV